MFSFRRSRQSLPDTNAATMTTPPPTPMVHPASERERDLERVLITLADVLEFGHGDLTRSVDVQTADPVALRALEQFGRFNGRVREMRLQLEQVTEETSLAAAKSGHQMQEIARHMGESHEQIGQAVTGVEQSQTGVSEVARAVSSAASLADQAKEATGQGAAVIRQAIESIGLIQEDIVVATGRVEALTHRSQQISKVSAIIEGIAQPCGPRCGPGACDRR